MKHAIALVLAVMLTPHASVLAADTSRPNIIFIFADDWGWGDLSCHGHPYVKTPNIDRLAREGTDFTRFAVASGVCSPSRTVVMTGHFPARYNIDGHFAWVPSDARSHLAIHAGDWKFIPGEEPELYNLKQALAEQHNLASQYPERVKELDAMLEAVRTQQHLNNQEPNATGNEWCCPESDPEKLPMVGDKR